uniref:Methyltransferase FkbM domain-containing protein n=1 Tax=Romanomermis culicivorax TaxID=13658 RepID=A0A915HGX4_ROMCU
IGEDIEAERKVKAYFPNCTFVGADPIYKSGKIYEEIGHFLNVAVTDKNGTVTASVYENQNYQDKNVQSIDFYSILQYMNSSNIDFFFLDAEGAEYPIFPLLKRNLLNNFKICQISVEIHGFAAQYRMTVEKFRDQMFDLLENSNYLPIFGQLMFNDAFNRMFWNPTTWISEVTACWHRAPLAFMGMAKTEYIPKADWCIQFTRPGIAEGGVD